MGVVERYQGPLALERLHDGQCRALPRVVDVLLVGDSDDQDPRAVGRTAGALAQYPKRFLDDALRHRGIDLAGEFDEPGRDGEFARLPGQIERVDRAAVPAEPRAEVERHIAERLGPGCLAHTPD